MKKPNVAATEAKNFDVDSLFQTRPSAERQETKTMQLRLKQSETEITSAQKELDARRIKAMKGNAKVLFQVLLERIELIDTNDIPRIRGRYKDKALACIEKAEESRNTIGSSADSRLAIDIEQLEAEFKREVQQRIQSLGNFVNQLMNHIACDDLSKSPDEDFSLKSFKSFADRDRTLEKQPKVSIPAPLQWYADQKRKAAMKDGEDAYIESMQGRVIDYGASETTWSPHL